MKSMWHGQVFITAISKAAGGPSECWRLCSLLSSPAEYLAPPVICETGINYPADENLCNHRKQEWRDRTVFESTTIRQSGCGRASHRSQSKRQTTILSSFESLLSFLVMHLRSCCLLVFSQTGSSPQVNYSVAPLASHIKKEVSQRANWLAFSPRYLFRAERQVGKLKILLSKLWHDTTGRLNPDLQTAKQPCNHNTTEANKQRLTVQYAS